mgnify:CR=1 FL=1
MKWFDKWFEKKCSEAWGNSLSNINVPSAKPSLGPQMIESRGMNFTVYRASGGYIIENRIYDQKTDRTSNSLHIVTDDKELGEEIAKIITYENLKN